MNQAKNKLKKQNERVEEILFPIHLKILVLFGSFWFWLHIRKTTAESNEKSTTEMFLKVLLTR